jgi:hypothetical protein
MRHRRFTVLLGSLLIASGINLFSCQLLLGRISICVNTPEEGGDSQERA